MASASTAAKRPSKTASKAKAKKQPIPASSRKKTVRARAAVQSPAKSGWATRRAKAEDYRARALKAWETKRAKAKALEREVRRQQKIAAMGEAHA